MQTDLNQLKKSQLQSLLFLGLGAFFLGHLLLLNPASLEDDFAEVRFLTPNEVLSFFQNENRTLAKGVPIQEAPSYSARHFTSFATSNNEPQWKLYAEKAYFYQTSQIVHGRDIIYETDQIKVTALESTYIQNENRIHLYGNVVAKTKDNLTIESEYAEVRFSPESLVVVPQNFSVKAYTSQVTTLSKGMEYYSKTEVLKLPEAVQVSISGEKITRIFSDFATFEKKKQTILFEKYATRSLNERFVDFNHDELVGKSRIVKVKLTPQDKLEHIEAIQDMSFLDKKDPAHPVSGIAGKAIFTELNNWVTLYDYPQVYQDGDTVTGDRIIMDRNRNTIEVDQSNAYNRR